MTIHPRPEPARNAIIGACWALIFIGACWTLIFILLLTLVGVLAASGWVR